MQPKRASCTATEPQSYGALRFSMRLILTLIVFGGLLRASQTPPKPAADRLPFSDRELVDGFRSTVVVVKPRDGIAADSLDAAEKSEGYTLLRKFPLLSGMRVLEIPNGITVQQAISHLEATGRYDFASLDKIRRVKAVPNDTNFSQQWALQNTGSTGGIAGADIKAVTGWEILHDAPAVIVATIDTGVRLTHSEIAANLWTNPNEIASNSIDDDRDGYIDDIHGINAATISNAGEGNPTDEYGHGTHVAGIIGASGNNGSGITGVAWKVQIMPLRAANAQGQFSSTAALECLQYAIAHGASIVNASYGTDGDINGYSQSEYQGMKGARDAGVIVVAAAGNASANIDTVPEYPACYALDNIVAVGCTDEFDYASSFSNTGSGTCDLFAPGERILSLSYAADTGTNAYIVKSGTSMAAPHVTGTLALMKAKFPNDNYRQLINRLLRSVDPLADLEGKTQTGGRLNLYRALTGTDNRPFNDDFASRALLNGATVNVRSSNAGATIEQGEPSHAGLGSTGSLWWDWTAPFEGRFVVDTAGSDIRTVVAIYTGAGLSSLAPVASNDGSASAYGWGKASFEATPGTTYHIAVASRNNVTGLAMAKISPLPINDAFASAAVLTGQSPSAISSNLSATGEQGEIILSQFSGRSLWYKWTAPKTARYQASVWSNEFDPVLAVYTGTSINLLATITYNNAPAASGTASSLVSGWDAVAGTTYLFCIDSKSTSLTKPGGQFALSIVDSAWQYDAGANITNAPAVAGNGTIYVCDTSGFLRAFNADGTQKWSYDMTYSQDTSSVSIADDGTVIAPSRDGFVHAVRADGTLRWKFDGGTFFANSPAIAKDGTVYFKSGDGELQALDLVLGTRKWSYATGSTDTYAGPIIGTDGTVYVGGGDKALHAISASGSRLWRFATDDDIYTSAAIDSAGNLYFGSIAGTFYSLTPSGALRWSRSFAPAISSSPAISKDGTVYFGGYDRKLHALKTSDGSDRWAFSLGDEVRASSPVVADDGTIYIGCYDGKLYAVNADGTLLRVYSTGDWIRSSPVISGKRVYIGSNDHKLYAFDISASATAADWPMRGANPSRLGRVANETASISVQPQGQQVLTGGTLSLSLVATGFDLKFQWYKDGQAIAGATTSTYTKANATIADSGSYTVVVSNTTSSKTSDVAPVNVVNLRKGRIYGLSTRGPAGSGSATMIVGVAMSAGTDGKKKNLIVRGLGPELANRSITNFLPNPQIELYQGANRVALNKDWGGTSALKQAFQSVSLADLASASKDAALLASLDPSNYTFLISDETGGSGIVLGELYDTDTTPISDPARATQGRLFGISSRALISDGDNVLIAGFSFDGDAPMTLLIQGVGPSLVPQGVTNPLLKPHLDIYQGGTIVATNEKWGGSSALSQAAAKAYATTLISPSSNDCAVLITLQPGTYTAILRSADSSSGVGLVEVYEVP